MITPRCPKCNNDKFEAIEQNIAGYVHSAIFVCCDKCESVVGVLDWANYKSHLDLLNKKVSAIVDGVDSISNDMKRNFEVLENRIKSEINKSK